MIEELEKFSTCEIADTLLKLGQENFYLPNIKSITPKNCKRICGLAHTVKFINKINQVKPIEKHYVDCASTNSIIIIQTPKNILNAVWGGLMTTRAQFIGVKGVIVDGFIRDIEEQNEKQFSCFAKGTSCLGSKPFVQVESIGNELKFGDDNDNYQVIVKPNDYILADENGVIIIPSNLINQVLDKVQKLQLIDSNCEKAIKNGKTIQESFNLFR